jgi:hypothetical protein
MLLVFNLEFREQKGRKYAESEALLVSGINSLCCHLEEIYFIFAKPCRQFK